MLTAPLRGRFGIVFHLDFYGHEDLQTICERSAGILNVEIDPSGSLEIARRGRGDRQRPTFGWDSLTPTELAVTELVADGLTNPQIAERLIVGRATVKTHVSNVLRKLDLGGRTQLATAYQRRTVEESDAQRTAADPT